MARPRLTEDQYKQYQEQRIYDKKLYKVLIFSDPHGWLADLRALRCINLILQSNKFDEVIINGDVGDFPYISRHTNRLYDSGVLSGYSEIAEIDYIREQILSPLRLSTKAKIRLRLGNHDERVTKPYLLNKGQLASLAKLYKHFDTTKYEEMLQLSENGIDYDPEDVYSLFDIFDIVHGLSIAKNASEKNIVEYFNSGSSGHTHKLSPKHFSNRKGNHIWYESGCTRLLDKVEYFPTGRVADWQQGFIEVAFLKEGKDIKFFGNAYLIDKGMCYYNKNLYNGNK